MIDEGISESFFTVLLLFFHDCLMYYCSIFMLAKRKKEIMIYITCTVSHKIIIALSFPMETLGILYLNAVLCKLCVNISFFHNYMLSVTIYF